MKIAYLHEKLATVAPIVGVAVDDPADKTTWIVSFSPSATEQQKAAAASIIGSFDIMAPTADDVREEAQRRIIALTGTKDITGCLIKQHNAQMRATELTLIKAQGGIWTPEQVAEAAALQALADQIKAIRAASNVLEPNPPADYADNKYWP